MENTPNEAPAAPAESVATPNTNETTSSSPAAPDMHGFTSDDLAGMRTFIDNNGGWEKIKSRISNPEPKTEPVAAQDTAKQFEPEKQVKSPYEPADPNAVAFKTPAGAITVNEYFAKRYFMDLADTEKYSGIANEIRSGDVLKEMASLGMKPVYPDGSIDEEVVEKFLNLKAKTVPAKQTSATPEASAAPTVDYVPVEGDIKDMQQAMAVLQQDSRLRSSGLAGHPSAKAAEEFMRAQLNPNSAKK